MTRFGSAVRLWATSAILLLAVLPGYDRPRAAEMSVTGRASGLVARLSQADGRARVEWRFEQTVTFDPQAVSVGLGGGRAPLVAAYPYPAPGQKTAIVGTIDLGDTAREPDLTRLRAAAMLLLLQVRPDQAIVFEAYTGASALVRPAAPSPAAMAAAFDALHARAERSDLGAAIESGLARLKAMGGARRGLYVFTDGHDDGARGYRGLAEKAVAQDVVVFILQVPSARPADLVKLTALARATGGLVIGPNDLTSFLARPFELLESGGVEEFDVSGLRRLPWDPATLRAVLPYGQAGADRLTLHLPFAAAPADWGMTLSAMGAMPFAWPFLLVGALLLGVGAGLVALLKGQPRRTAKRAPGVGNVVSVAPRPDASRLEAPKPRARARAQSVADELPTEFYPSLNATLQDQKTGRVYTLRQSTTHLGRAENNDIIVDDGAASRRHLTIETTSRAGLFRIHNGSRTNPTLLNGVAVETGEMSDGDVLTVGNTELRLVMRDGAVVKARSLG